MRSPIFEGAGLEFDKTTCYLSKIMAYEPYRWRVHGTPDDSRGLVSVWSFEQETLPGYFVHCTEDSPDGSSRAKTKFKVRAAKRVEETSDWGIPKSELFVEVIERTTQHLLRNYDQKLLVPFVGCGAKVNRVYILRARNGSLSSLRHWSKKCGSERGADSGEYFICPDCALIFGYCW